MGVHVQGGCMSWAGGFAPSAPEWPQMPMEQRAEVHAREPTQVGQVVVVVDPYGGGGFLVDELLLRGWPLVAVRSSNEVHQAMSSSWDPTLFECTLVHCGDVLGTARSLREGLKRPVAVVAGCESGADLADALAEVLSLRGNRTALSRCRQDKYFMHERLRDCGLRACCQQRCSTVREVMTFAAELGAWPLVVKPCASSGTDCVIKCDGPNVLAYAAAAILASRNMSGRRHEAVLVQEFLHGTEYMVDCVSMDGQHLVSAIWVCRKARIGSDFAYDRTTTVPFSGEAGSVQRMICEYVFQCLAALGIQTGASQSKVIYSETQGPCLIKTRPHVHGSVAPAVWAACAGREQAQAFLVADALTQGGMMFQWKLESVAMGSPAYELANYSIILDLQCHEDGILARSVEEVAGEWIRGLSSFWLMKCDLEHGDRVYRSRDMLTSPGYVVLIGPDPAIVEQDAALIREAERNGQVYIFSASTSSKTPTPPACSDDEGCGPGARARDPPGKLQGTWGKCGLFLPVAHEPSPCMRALEAPPTGCPWLCQAQMANLLSSPSASPELLPKVLQRLPGRPNIAQACAEFVLDGALGLE